MKINTITAFVENGRFKFIRGSIEREFALDDQVKILGNYTSMIALVAPGVSDAEANREVSIFLYEELFKQRKRLTALSDSIPAMFVQDEPNDY